jgi:hypothetical protein
MSGTLPDSRACRRLLRALLPCLLMLARGDLTLSATMPVVRRDEMIALVKSMADHQWTVTAASLRASCVPNYRSSFELNQRVTGVAYDWGGMDTIAAFDRKIAAGQAAGSHQQQGVSQCTAGVDCSGLVSLAWRQTKKFGTSGIDEIAAPLQIDVLTGLQKGDALNRAGSHIVLFDSYNPDGSINVYEAVGGTTSRVVFSRNQSWSRFLDPNKLYVAIGYKAVAP